MLALIPSDGRDREADLFDLGTVGPLDAELLATMTLEFAAVDLELPLKPMLLDLPEPLDLALPEVDWRTWEAEEAAALDGLRGSLDPLVSADEALDLARQLQERLAELMAQGRLRGGSVVARRGGRQMRQPARRTKQGAP